MNRREMLVRYGAALVLLAFAVTPTSLAAQWLRHRDPKIPRTNDGQPDLTARVPRAPDGRPDLSGVWAAQPTGELRGLLGPDPGSNPLAADLQFISKYALNVFSDLKPEEEPMRPEAVALFKRRVESEGRISPRRTVCPAAFRFRR